MKRLGILLGLCAAIGCIPGKSDELPEPVPLPLEAATKARLARVATRDDLLQSYHDKCATQFVKASGFGGGRMEVFGHLPGGYAPSLSLATADQGDDGVSPWHLEKVELVSLLKDATPGVYPADRVMGFRRLQPATRTLDAFETQALAYLQAGERLLVTESPGHVRALGAIRVRADCKRCHDKPEGSLLGAFTYSFKPGPAPAAVAPMIPVAPLPAP